MWIASLTKFDHCLMKNVSVQNEILARLWDLIENLNTCENSCGDYM